MKNLKLFLVVLSLLIAFNQSSSSVLSNSVAGMADRSWAKMPDNASLAGLTMGYSLLYWCNSGVWNPVAHKMQWVGGPGTCCATPATYQLITYNEATDTWSIAATPYEGSGHSYDGNAMDPATGVHYFGKKDELAVKTWNGSSWGALPDLPWSATTPSMAWFPDINNGKGGLLFLSEAGRLAWYDGTKWTVITGLTGLAQGSYNTFAEYNSVQKVVWLGAGNGTDKVSYKVDAQLKVTRMKDAPISLNNSSSLQAADVRSGMYFVVNLTDHTYWEYDIANDIWAQITDMTGTPVEDHSYNTLIVPLPEHGAIMLFRHYWEYRNIYIYKHGVSSATDGDRNVLPAAIPVMRISPNPFTSTARIQIGGGKGGKIGIYDLNGKRIREIDGSREIIWNASGMAPGVYLVKSTVNDRVLTAKLLLNR
jgi:hypothetical protein